jgi:chromosome segregation ATPase
LGADNITRKERRIAELKKLIPSVEDELSCYTKDFSLAGLEKKISDLNTEISCLDGTSDDDVEEIDQKEGLIESLHDLTDLKKELSELDPPYIPAKAKQRSERALGDFFGS